MKQRYTSTLMLGVLLAVALTAQAQSQKTYIHMKSGETKELFCDQIDSITFATLNYEYLKQDYDVVPTTFSGQYYNDEEYGDFSLSFQNTPSSNGTTATGAQLVNLELITKSCSPMDISIIAGEYTIATANDRSTWSLGSYLSGTSTKWGTTEIPLGTYIRLFDENGKLTKEIGYAKAGTVKVQLDGDQVTFDMDIETESGHKFTMKYTGDTSRIYDYSESYMPRLDSTQGTPLGTDKNDKGFPVLLKLVRK